MDGWRDGGKKHLEGEKKDQKNSFGCLFKVKRVKPLFYLN
jgi:ribosomal protein S15P/S13E